LKLVSKYTDNEHKVAACTWDLELSQITSCRTFICSTMFSHERK